VHFLDSITSIKGAKLELQEHKKIGSTSKMKNFRTKTLFSALIFLFFLVQAMPASAFLDKYRAFVYNRLPNNTNPLVVHCQSKDDDIGFQTLYVDQYISWHFRMNFWGTT
jgi:hypothetical protein